MEEIGLETVALWKLYLEEKLNLIMPYYNKLYETTVKDYDYMVDVDYTEEWTENEVRKEGARFSSHQDSDTDTTDDTTTNQSVDTNSTSTNTGAPTSHTMHNDFPQAPVQTKDYATYEDYTQQKIDDKNVTDAMEETNSTVKNITTTNQEVEYGSTNNLDANRDTAHDFHKKGLNGARSFTDLLLQYRESLINIDAMIIDELKDLFMLVY